jgi:hypothetical protein
MPMKTAKVHNPATLLHIINGGKKPMATARKPATRNSARTANKRNPARRRANTPRKNSIVVLTPAQAKSAGVSNPHRRRSTRRRSNPAIKGMIVDAAWAGLIPFHASGFAGVGLRFGAAYLTGFVGEKIFGSHAGNLMAIGGGAAAAGELVNIAFGKIGAAGTGLLNPGVQANIASTAAPPPPPGAESQPMSGYDYNYMITDGMHGMGDIIADPQGLSDIYGYVQ